MEQPALLGLFYSSHMMALFSLRFLVIETRKLSSEMANDKSHPQLLHQTDRKPSCSDARRWQNRSFGPIKWPKAYKQALSKQKGINFRNAGTFL